VKEGEVMTLAPPEHADLFSHRFLRVQWSDDGKVWSEPVTLAQGNAELEEVGRE
jgi:hypothetical protein